MTSYGRSVAFRVAGALTGFTLWFAVVFVSLGGGGVWPIWLVALGIGIGAFLIRRRLGPGPGMGAFVVGLFAPFLGMFINVAFGTGTDSWFWIPLFVLLLAPLPSAARPDARAETLPQPDD